jgi:hypothetical protein
MKFETIPTKAISIGLVLAGAGLEFSSCCPDILQDGNQPIAGMIAIVGLLAIAGGWLGLRSASATLPEQQRVRRCLYFEHLLYCAGLGAWWLIAERETFFIDTPFGRDILGFQKLLIAVLAVVAILAIALRTALHATHTRKQRSIFPVSAAAWRAVAAGAVITGGLNAVQGQEVRHLDAPSCRISVFSRGFPLPAVQVIRTETATDQVSPQGPVRTQTLTLDDGTEVRRSEEGITVVRYRRPPKRFESASTVRLPDRTRIDFRDGKISVSLRGRTSMVFDVARQKAAFAGGVTSQRNIRGIAIDLLVGLMVIVHFGICAERLERGRSEFATSISYGSAT